MSRWVHGIAHDEPPQRALRLGGLTRPRAGAGGATLQQLAGNRAVAALIGEGSVGPVKTPTVPVQRCGDHHGPGCPCQLEKPRARDYS